MKIRFFLLSVFIFVQLNSISQEWKFKNPGCLYSSGGYVFQKEHVFESSGPIFGFTNEKTLIGFGPAVQFNYYEKKLYVPFGGIVQLASQLNDNFSLTIDLLYIHRETLDQKLNILTPEIGFVVKHIHIKYGYNYSINNDLYPWVNKNKICLLYRILK